MDKRPLNDIMEMVRISLTDDVDDDDCVLFIGMAKFLNLVEAYIKLREFVEKEQ